ncbi:MAG: hypothetical protein IT530_20520 [Burkholderiales bacterium]|nr:hypothetical protein [Burkholderiales bacterium]
MMLARLVHRAYASAFVTGSPWAKTVLACATLTLATTVLAQDASVYAISPHTARQLHWRDGRIQSIEGTVFLGLRLAPVQGAAPERYTHLLPPHISPKASVELPVRALNALDTELARAHPFEFPFARVLVYWGCGDTPGKGQPRIYLNDPDQARLSRKLAPSPEPTARDRHLIALPKERRHQAAAEARIDTPSMLEGDHALLGPASRHDFRIAPERGFLPPIDIVRASIVRGAGARVEWSAVPGATAYFASTFVQHAGSRDVVVWTSSRVPEAGWLLARGHPGEEAVKRLLARGVLLASDATTCTLPPAVVRHTPGTLVYHLSAFGSESTVRADGPPPAAPIEVQVRARTTATIMFTGFDSAELALATSIR